MAELLGKELPEEVARVLQPEKEARGNDVISLVTTDKSGYSRVCLLSPYQVVSSGRRDLYLAVYNGSRTEKNLRRSRKASLILVTPPSLHYIHGSVTSVLGDDHHGNSIYLMRVRQVAEDYSEKAPINSNLTFDPAHVKGFYSEVYAGIARLVSSREKKEKVRGRP
jgi:hypothetical protein